MIYAKANGFHRACMARPVTFNGFFTILCVGGFRSSGTIAHFLCIKLNNINNSFLLNEIPSAGEYPLLSNHNHFTTNRKVNRRILPKFGLTSRL